MANTPCMLPCVACNLAAAKAFGLPTAAVFAILQAITSYFASGSVDASCSVDSLRI
jgi:hypothetical protein